MHRIFHIKAYEKEHGPHFNEEHARKAVMKMENEDGTRGPHWSIEETTTLASQYGITLGSKFNRYDWFVALIMFYPFNPYMFNNRVRTVDNFGIPVIRTIYVTSDVENSSVTYGICPKIWRQLPCEGIFLLNVTHVPSSTIPAGALVSIDPTRSSSSTTSSNTSSGAKPLINGSGDQMPTEEVSNGNRYFVYYNKNNGIFQIVNHIVTPAAPAA